MAALIIMKLLVNWNCRRTSLYLTINCFVLLQVYWSVLYGVVDEMVDVTIAGENQKSTIIDAGSKEQLLAVGYHRSYLKTIFFHIISILCLGFPYVLTYWHNVFSIRWQYVQCSISEAQVLVLEVIINYTLESLSLSQFVFLFRMFTGKHILPQLLKNQLVDHSHQITHFVSIKG